MRKLSSLKGEELKAVYDKNDILKTMAREESEEMGFEFVKEKIAKLKDGFSDYNFGLYEYNNFFKVNKEADLIKIIENYIDSFSASSEVINSLHIQENKVKIFTMLVEDEILKDIKYIENYTNEEVYENFYEYIVDYLDNFYVNEKGVLIEIKEYK